MKRSRSIWKFLGWMVAALPLAVVLFLTSCSLAHAQSASMTGKMLIESCTAKFNKALNPTDQAGNEGVCLGFVAGVMDAYAMSYQFCLPPGIKPQPVVSGAIDYVLAHRELHNEFGAVQVLLALKARWPCVGQSPQITAAQRQFQGAAINLFGQFFGGFPR